MRCGNRDCPDCWPHPHPDCGPTGCLHPDGCPCPCHDPVKRPRWWPWAVAFLLSLAFTLGVIIRSPQP